MLRCATAALLAGVWLAVAARAPAAAEDEVVAAFYPLAYAAEQIAGSSVDVRNLTPAGAEPHDLELTPGDVRDVDGATLVLYLGDGFMPGPRDGGGGAERPIARPARRRAA